MSAPGFLVALAAALALAAAPLGGACGVSSTDAAHEAMKPDLTHVGTGTCHENPLQQTVQAGAYCAMACGFIVTPALSLPDPDFRAHGFDEADAVAAGLKVRPPSPPPRA